MEKIEYKFVASELKDFLLDALACNGDHPGLNIRLYRYYIQHFHLSLVDKVRGVDVEPYLGDNDTKGVHYYWKTVYNVDDVKKFIEDIPRNLGLVDVCFIYKSVSVIHDGRPVCNMVARLGYQKGYVGE